MNAEVANGYGATMTSDAAASAAAMAPHAFISYVREDSDEVDSLQRALEEAGVRVWRDTSDLWPGEDWRVRIRAAITRNALAFIACFSRHSAVRDSSYQNEELTLAIDQLRRRRPDLPWLIPVRFDDCAIPDRDIGAGRTLASLQRADVFGADRDEATARLVQAVKRVLGAEQATPAASAPPDSELSRGLPAPEQEDALRVALTRELARLLSGGWAGTVVLPGGAAGTGATVTGLRAIDAAYDARGRSVPEITHYLAGRFGLPPGEPDLVRWLLRRVPPVCLVIVGVDRAETPDALIREVLRPLAVSARSRGVRLVLGFDGPLPGKSLPYEVALDPEPLARRFQRIVASADAEARLAELAAAEQDAARLSSENERRFSDPPALPRACAPRLRVRLAVARATRAACTAIDALPDGVFFAIIAGNRKAESLFPSAGGLAAINAKTRAAAKRQVMRLQPEGGTEIGRWLLAARQLFATEPDAGTIRHAVLYTDGRNEHETSEALGAALSSCADEFLCDVRGLGNDWDYRELLRIAGALHGDATAVLQIADLADDFTQLILRERRLVVRRTYLRLRPSRRFQIGSIAQTHPVRVDLTQRQQPADGAAIDIPLGSWEAETRRYHLTMRFAPDTLPTGEDLRAAGVELLMETASGERERYADTALVVRRHSTPGDKTREPDSVTQVEKERELAVTMQACADAWLHGRITEADDELEHGIRLARAVADPVRLRLLESIANIGKDGRARVRADVTRGEMQRLGLDSTKTSTSITRTGAEEEAGQRLYEARTCRACGATTYTWQPKHCEECGRSFDDGALP